MIQGKQEEGPRTINGHVIYSVQICSNIVPIIAASEPFMAIYCTAGSTSKQRSSFRA